MAALTSWPRPATVAAAVLLAGFGAYEAGSKAPPPAHVAAAASHPSATVGASIDQQAASKRPKAFTLPCVHDSLEESPPYAADHLDALFVDFSHPEPLSPASVREMALTQFLGLSVDRRRGTSAAEKNTLDND